MKKHIQSAPIRRVQPQAAGIGRARGVAETDRADAAALSGGQVPVVLFADLVGSTTLYDVLGDAEAKRLIDEALGYLSVLATHHGGRVIKTIGDEIMCLFQNAERGFQASASMQGKIDLLPQINGTKRRIRIGFHAGPVIQEGGDVFGDTVNVAARLTALAKGMQIMTTHHTVDGLPEHLRKMTRGIGSVSVKGKSTDLAVCEVLWREEGGLTRMMSGKSPSRSTVGELVLRHGRQELKINAKRPWAAVGRDPESDVMVIDNLASRHHARIEKRGDKFFLSDHSTNGTTVRFDGESEIALRREEIMLRGSGHIVFGTGELLGDRESVEFQVRG